MANSKMICIRLPEEMLKEAKEAVSFDMFSNMNEFIRHSIRKAIDDYKTRKALRMLKQNFGMIKRKIPRMSAEERDKIALQLIEKKKKGYDAFKSIGF